ncbi:hypothetical protein HDV57DRAFT_492201, partial [Trichoderma longibrachiatum]
MRIGPGLSYSAHFILILPAPWEARFWGGVEVASRRDERRRARFSGTLLEYWLSRERGALVEVGSRPVMSLAGPCRAHEMEWCSCPLLVRSCRIHGLLLIFSSCERGRNVVIGEAL